MRAPDRTSEQVIAAEQAFPRERAAYLAQAARAANVHLKAPERAIEMYKAAFDADPLAPGVLDSLKELLYTRKRWGELVVVLKREADQAARWIAANATGQSVLVLSRKHEPLGLIQKALQRYGVQASKQSKNDLADVPAVQDLLALLHFLISPQSDLDLARVLKSPLFAWTDEQLMQLRHLQLAALPDKK